ncbi:hypothetical protein L228DRAFT_247901 [Xylona heveae TC161]|uniref:Uncharacterized protein n=1 Tax=Xylona heveae (strain CBS 132557 / TC161) TaxID=1328760 RepID=A0A165GJ67_XYLHT|nr:hypothetical protein L228DRAFT_247901 [Xylona heveae TC161]KZF22252.1 hypothetical protein L228DRAFT_247901 [Xylona heveae TC161]
MSSTTSPITPAAFALAIADLPLGNLHAKAAELRNSISHLVRSNEQLLPYAQDGDTDCGDAIRENEEVIARMETRIDLLRQEVERRGFRWGESEEEEQELAREALEPGEQGAETGPGGHLNGADSAAGRENDLEAAASSGPNTGGRLTDAELQRRLMEQLEAAGGDDNEEEGVHL